MSEFNRQLSALPRKEVDFSRLERKSKGLEEVYTLLQTRLKQAEIQQGVTDPSVQVVDTAIAPLRPSSPRKALNLLQGMFGGLLLGCMGAFLREYADKSVRSRHDVVAATGFPVLGLIPQIRQPSGRIALVTTGGKYVTPWRAETAKLSPPPPPPSKRPLYTFLTADEDEAAPTPARAPASPPQEELRPVLRMSTAGVALERHHRGKGVAAARGACGSARAPGAAEPRGVARLDAPMTR